MTATASCSLLPFSHFSIMIELSNFSQPGIAITFHLFSSYLSIVTRLSSGQENEKVICAVSRIKPLWIRDMSFLPSGICPFSHFLHSAFGM